jgi:uncharacterized protein
MRYIEPHAHMVSRTTDDYLAMATPAARRSANRRFGRGSTAVGRWLLRLLPPVDRLRAETGGEVRLAHYCWLCLNPKESEDVKLAEEVIGIIPNFWTGPHVLGIGEIGLNKNSRNELAVFEKHVDLAARHGQLILIHTPHLEDKLKGTRLIVDALKADGGSNRSESSLTTSRSTRSQLVLDAGFWAG